MSKRSDYFKALQALEESFPGVMAYLEGSTVKPLAALGVGYAAYQEGNTLSAENKAIVTTLKAQIAMLGGNESAIKGLQSVIDGIVGNPHDNAWKVMQEYLKLATGTRSTGVAMIEGMSGYPFQRQGIYYRLAWESSEIWRAYTVNNGTKQAFKVFDSETLTGNLAEGKTPSITSYTRARIVVQSIHKLLDGTDSPAESLIKGFNSSWQGINAGGVGRGDNGFYPGSYAYQIEGNRATWEKQVAESGTYPQEKRTAKPK